MTISDLHSSQCISELHLGNGAYSLALPPFLPSLLPPSLSSFFPSLSSFLSFSLPFFSLNLRGNLSGPAQIKILWSFYDNMGHVSNWISYFAKKHSKASA
jgi:hypothetical protein